MEHEPSLSCLKPIGIVRHVPFIILLFRIPTFWHLFFRPLSIFSGTRSKKLLGAPGLTTWNKKLLGAPGMATRSKDATRVRATSLATSKPWPLLEDFVVAVCVCVFKGGHPLSNGIDSAIYLFPSSFLFLVAMPGPPSSVLAPSSVGALHVGFARRHPRHHPRRPHPPHGRARQCQEPCCPVALSRCHTFLHM